MLKLQICLIPHAVLVIPALILIAPTRGEAAARLSGNFSLEKVFASGQRQPEILTGGLSLEIVPATRKVSTRFLIPLQFSVIGGETNAQLFPTGNFGADVSGEWYTLNLQHGRNMSVNNASQLTETSSTSIGLSLLPPEMPRLNAFYTTAESSTNGSTFQTDSISFISGYQYKWLNVRGLYNLSESSSQNSRPLASSFFQFGMSANYEILPKTTVTGSYDLNGFTSENLASADSTSLTNSISMGVEIVPIAWLGLGGNFAKTVTSSSDSSVNDDQQTMGVNARLSLPGKIRISPSVDSNAFNDRGKKRNVTTFTLAVGYRERLVEKVLLGLNAARSYDHDPGQGTNVRDSFGMDALMDITPRISARLNLAVSRRDNSQFVTVRSFDASGTLAERDNFDDRPAGFTFLDTVNNNLYTKNSPLLKDWSPPVHIVPITGQYSVSKGVLLTMIPTDKTTLTLNYTSISSTGELDLAEPGSQSLSASLGYQPNRRTTIGFSGTASLPEESISTYSVGASLSHRLFRGPELSLSYGWQSTGKDNNIFSTAFTVPLRKQIFLNVNYTSSQFLREDQTYILKVRLNKNF